MTSGRAGRCHRKWLDSDLDLGRSVVGGRRVSATDERLMVEAGAGNKDGGGSGGRQGAVTGVGGGVGALRTALLPPSVPRAVPGVPVVVVAGRHELVGG